MLVTDKGQLIRCLGRGNPDRRPLQEDLPGNGEYLPASVQPDALLFQN